MLDSLIAELIKLRSHKATWFLIWGYPVLCILIFAIVIAVGLTHGFPPTDYKSPINWINATTTFWGILQGTNGRYLTAAFVAVVFAGEYGWNTWKLIIPHRARLKLIAAKYAAAFLLLLATSILTAALTILGRWSDNVLTHDIIPAGITAGDLLKAHGTAALIALGPILVTIAYTSLAAVLTRSTIAALIIGIVATTIEAIITQAATIFSSSYPSIAWAALQGTPGYHLSNLASWIGKGVAMKTRFDGSIVTTAYASSLLVVAAWAIVLITLTFTIFRRQDIN